MKKIQWKNTGKWFGGKTKEKRGKKRERKTIRK